MKRTTSLSVLIGVVVCCTSFHADLPKSWRVLSRQNLGHPGPFFALIYFDELNGVGLNPVGFGITADGGMRWRWQLQSGRHTLRAMRFVDRQNGWILGSERDITDQAEQTKLSSKQKPLILQTADGGDTWRKIDVDYGLRSGGERFTTFSGICSERSGAVWVVGDAGILQGTVAVDKFRTSQITHTPAALNDVVCNQFGDVTAVGDEGLIMRYAGGQWKSTRYAPDAFFSRVKSIGNAGWLIGGRRSRDNETRGLLLSSNNWTQWSDNTPSDAGALTDVTLSGLEGWLVGLSGSIYRSKDAGMTWQKEASPTDIDLFTVFSLDSQLSWIGGDKLTILKWERKYESR